MFIKLEVLKEQKPGSRLPPSIQAPKFRVTIRSVRDRYTHLTNRKAEQLREEEKASGVEVTPTELDMLLEEILEKENAAKAEIESGDTKKRKAEQDKASADSIRRLAMERMSQTNTREGAVVRALASHQCGPGSIPRSGVKCGLSLLVLFSAPRGFLRVLRFPLSSKTKI